MKCYIINETLNTPQNEIMGWDCHTNKIGGVCYYKPLCYQLFPETENQKHWVTEIENTFNNILYTPLNTSSYDSGVVFREM